MEERKLRFSEPVESLEKGFALLKELAEKASTTAAFSEPVVQGETAVITAADVGAGLGFGFGMGRGRPHPHRQPTAEEKPEEHEQVHGHKSGGGGGGGGAGARPIAVIKIQHDEVEVIPVLDFTKIALAVITMLGSMAVTWGRMHRTE